MISRNGSVWPKVRTNRHKINKVRDCSADHLAGRLALLRSWLPQAAAFPAVQEDIAAEIERIETEQDRRLSPRYRAPAIVEQPRHEIEDIESLVALMETEEFDG